MYKLYKYRSKEDSLPSKKKKGLSIWIDKCTKLFHEIREMISMMSR